MIFIDTGAFVARYVGRDQKHNRAREHWEAIQRRGVPCLTSNLVLDETLTLLARRTDYHFAAQRARNLYASQILQIVRPTRDDEVAAIEFFEKYATSR